MLAAAAKSLQSCPTLCDPMDRSPTRLLHPWDFPGKSTGVGCHCLLQSMLTPCQKKTQTLKYKLNDDIYRHTQAERFHYQHVHTAREVKGILQEGRELTSDGMPDGHQGNERKETWHMHGKICAFLLSIKSLQKYGTI